jgi:predicted PurR-regulated permease PerM
MKNEIFTPFNGDDSRDRKRVLGLIHLSLVGGLFGLIILVMRPFIVPLIWSVILVILLLPLFRLLESRLCGRQQTAAILVTAGVGLFFILAVVPLLWHLGHESVMALKSIEGEGKALSAEWIHRFESLPFVGPQLAPYLRDEMNDGYAGVIEAIKTYNVQWLSLVTRALSNIVAVIFGGLISMLSLYFLFAHISTLAKQIRNGAVALGGPAYLTLLESVYETVRATLWGVLITALAQGALAGLAYLVAGVQFPLLLTILTVLAALLPFGPPFIYVPVAFMMAGSGYSWVSVTIFLAWCVGVVSVVDNLLRPYFISQVTRLSYLLVLFGIIGGITTFGFVGVFIGPVVMTLAMRLWSELLT